jgi:hypothetical protein
MSTSTGSTQYEFDDPGGKQAVEMASDPNVALIIHVRRDGTVMVNNLSGNPFQNITSPGPLPPLPAGAQLQAAYIVHTTNPTCVLCLHGGGWRQICF